MNISPLLPKSLTLLVATCWKPSQGISNLCKKDEEEDGWKKLETKRSTMAKPGKVRQICGKVKCSQWFSSLTSKEYLSFARCFPSRVWKDKKVKEGLSESQRWQVITTSLMYPLQHFKRLRHRVLRFLFLSPSSPSRLGIFVPYHRRPNLRSPPVEGLLIRLPCNGLRPSFMLGCHVSYDGQLSN